MKHIKEKEDCRRLLQDLYNILGVKLVQWSSKLANTDNGKRFKRPSR